MKRMLAALAVVLGACGSSEGGGPDASPGQLPDAAPGSVRITAVSIVGRTGNQVRVGDTVDLVATGTSLAGATGVTVGSIATPTVSSSNTSLRVTLVVPHGGALGALALTAKGVSFPAAVTVTDVTVDMAGNDTSGFGTGDAPFRTVTKGLSVAQSGDTVRLHDGTYIVAETWPMVVPAGVSLVGASTAGTIITSSMGQSPVQTGVKLAGTLSTVHMTGFTTQCVDVDPGTPSIDHVLLDTCGSDSVHMLQGTLTVTASKIVGSTVGSFHGINVNATVASSLTVTGTEISNVNKTATLVGAIHVHGPVTLTATNCNIHDNAAGVYALTSANVTVHASMLQNNVYGLAVFSDATYVPPSLDFTTNTISGNTSFDVYDGRLMLAAANGPILMLSSPLDGMAFTAGDMFTGAATNGKLWNIVNSNERIGF